MAHRKVGEILADEGYITERQVAQLLAMQAKIVRGKKRQLFGEVAIEARMITPRQLQRALDLQQYGHDGVKRFIKGVGKWSVNLAVLAVLYKGGEWALNKYYPLRPGNPAPGFSLKSAQGYKEVKLADFKGKVVLLNFWGPSCGPCREELFELEATQIEYQKRGFSVVGIAQDYADVGADSVRRLARGSHMNFPVLFGSPQIGTTYGGIRQLPTSFLIDKRGRIVQRYDGVISQSELDPEIQKLL